MVLLVAVIIGIVLLIAMALFAWAAARPGTFRIERSTRIQAPPEKIFPLISDFHNWVYWSPYERLDPAMTKSYHGAPSGQGAIYEWDGRKAGKGRMEIIGVAPPSKITIQLEFMKPFEGHNTAEFALDAQGGSTNVTWSMWGLNGMLAKFLSIFVSMERLLGKEFENGLANLKSVAEK